MKVQPSIRTRPVGGAVSVDDEREIRAAGDRVDGHQRQAEHRGSGRNSRLHPAMNRCSVNCDAGAERVDR